MIRNIQLITCNEINCYFYVCLTKGRKIVNVWNTVTHGDSYVIPYRDVVLGITTRAQKKFSLGNFKNLSLLFVEVEQTWVVVAYFCLT